MEIKKYSKEYEEAVMKLIEEEGKDWECYSSPEHSSKYKLALTNSITYVAFESGELCGYSRSLNDCNFYIYVCDLLVSKRYRGNQIGKKLMECIYKDYPNYIIYVMSGVDKYYEKLGYNKEGSIFEVKK